MTRDYPHQAAGHLTTIRDRSAAIVATLIDWSHHPTRAPRHPVLYCPVLDGNHNPVPGAPPCDQPGCREPRYKRTLCRFHWHDAQHCEYCPTTQPHVPTRKPYQDVRPTEAAAVEPHNVIEQIVDVLEQQTDNLVEHRNRIYGDGWWPGRLSGSAASRFGGDLVKDRGAMLGAAGDIKRHAVDTAAACPHSASGPLGPYDGWMDEHVGGDVLALSECASELRRQARRWAIGVAVPRGPTVDRCSVGECHKPRKYKRLCQSHYRAQRREAS